MNSQGDLHRLGFKLKFVYSIVGLLLGLACIIAGVILGLAGVKGHTTWTASLLGFSTNINDAAPGVIIFVVGIFIVLITRFTVRDRIVMDEHTAGDAPSLPTPSVHADSGGEPWSSGRIERDLEYMPRADDREDLKL